MKFLILIALLLAGPVSAAVRDHSVTWTHDCMTVPDANGVQDDLDPDGDGVCELMTGWRIYDAETGDFIEGIPEDGARTHVFAYNDAYGTQCFQMTGIIDNGDGTVDESALSNVGGCLNVVPLGVPSAPVLQP